MFVESREDIIKNIRTLERYRNSKNKEENEFYKQTIGKGFCFVVLEVNGKLYFGPSRFVGYMNNTMEEHLKKRQAGDEMVVFEGKERYQRDGRDTNPRIDRILIGKHKNNVAMESEYLKFCEINGIKPANRDNNGGRKYWKVHKLSDLTL